MCCAVLYCFAVLGKCRDTNLLWLAWSFSSFTMKTRDWGNPPVLGKVVGHPKQLNDWLTSCFLQLWSSTAMQASTGSLLEVQHCRSHWDLLHLNLHFNKLLRSEAHSHLRSTALVDCTGNISVGSGSNYAGEVFPFVFPYLILVPHPSSEALRTLRLPG